jgi:hypothetical protein
MSTWNNTIQSNTGNRITLLEPIPEARKSDTQRRRRAITRSVPGLCHEPCYPARCLIMRSDARADVTS